MPASEPSRPRRRRGIKASPAAPAMVAGEVVSDSDSDSSVANNAPLTEAEEAAKKRTVTTQKKKKGEMLRRTVVAFQLFGVFLLLVWLGHIYMFLAVLVTQAYLFRELINVRYKHTKELHLPWFRTFHWCCFWSAAFWAHGENCLLFIMERGGDQLFFVTPGVVQAAAVLYSEFKFVTFGLYATNLIFFVLSLKKGFYRYQMRQLGWTVFVLVLIVLQLSAISDNLFCGFYWFWLPASLVVCNDTFAYFSGKLFGRRFIKRPFLSVSPNKTWEGFIGALFCTLIWSQIFSAVLTQYKYLICPVGDPDCELPEYFLDREYSVPIPTALAHALGSDAASSPADGAWISTTAFAVVQKPIQMHALVLALFSSLVAPFGGFFASAIKRAFQIKDFDSVIPGHGGLMDRLDCQLIMAMYTRVHFLTWVQAFAVTVPTLMRSFFKLPPERQQEVYERIQAYLQEQAGGAAAAATP